MTHIDYDDPIVQIALRLAGTWYAWGGGHPCRMTLDDVAGLAVGAYDCSGSVIAFATVSGQIRAGSVEANAHRLAMSYLDEVSDDDVRAGDFYVYDRDHNGTIEHITIALGAGMELSMSRGGSGTHGDDPFARGAVQPARGYITAARWKPSVRR